MEGACGVELNAEFNMNAELDIWLGQLTAIQQDTSIPSSPQKRVSMQSTKSSVSARTDDSLSDFDSILGELSQLESSLSTSQQFDPNPSFTPIPPRPVPNPQRQSCLNELYSEQSLGELDSQLQSALSQLGDFTEVTSSRLSSVHSSSRASVDSSQDSPLHNNNRKDFSPVKVPLKAGDSAEEGKPVELTDILRSSHSCDSLDFDACETSTIDSSSSELDVHDHLEKYQEALEKEDLSVEEQQAKMKAEKMRLALEKLKEANIKKLFVRAHTTDGSSKSILVEESMTVGEVCQILVAKNHAPLSIKWSLVEQLPAMHMERIFEDHDRLVENMVFWTRDSENKIIFAQRTDKYDVFIHPEKYLLEVDDSQMTQAARDNLIEEYFSEKSPRVPELEGMLHLKTEGKKSWKKLYFSLRASGLYYNPKGKAKSSKDLVCMLKFDLVEVYTSINWRKTFKAPSEFGFALKHPQIQKGTSKHIKYLCAEDQRTFLQWITAVRMAKCGYQLRKNYEQALRDMAAMEQSRNQKSEAQQDLSRGSSRKSSLGDLTDSVAVPRQVAEVQPSVQMREKKRERSPSNRQSPKKMIPVLPLTTNTTMQLAHQNSGSLRRISQETIKRPSVVHGDSVSERRNLPPPPPPSDDPLDGDFPLPPPPCAAVLQEMNNQNQQAEALMTHYATLSKSSKARRSSQEAVVRPVAPVPPMPIRAPPPKPSMQPFSPYTNYFIEDLHRVHEQKQHQQTPHFNPLPVNSISASSFDYLPPPPAELLEGLRKPRRKAPPPPPPKRSRNTHLSQS